MLVALTFDVDWVHTSAIDLVISLLDEYDIKGTFFATHKDPLLLQKNFVHEVGIHPNFNRILQGEPGNIETVIDELLQLYPKAAGFRSHSLTQSSSILSYCFKKGLKYDSNIYNPYGGIPYIDYSGLHRFTHTYVDLGHLIDAADLSIENLALSRDKINILDFHPIHILLNTPTVRYYDLYKKYTTKSELIRYKNKDERGLGDLFVALLKFIKQEKMETKTLIELI